MRDSVSKPISILEPVRFLLYRQRGIQPNLLGLTHHKTVCLIMVITFRGIRQYTRRIHGRLYFFNTYIIHAPLYYHRGRTGFLIELDRR